MGVIMSLQNILIPMELLMNITKGHINDYPWVINYFDNGSVVKQAMNNLFSKPIATQLTNNRSWGEII